MMTDIIAEIEQMTDRLEELALSIAAVDSGRAEKFIAHRLLVDAAAATRGALIQLDRLVGERA